MTRIILYALVFIVLIHGLIHLMGFVAYWPLAEMQELPYKTTLLNGWWDVGRAGMRIYSVLWLLATVAFGVAAAGVVTQQDWSRSIMIGPALLSIVIIGFDWQQAFRGAIVDGLILIAYLFGPLLASFISAAKEITLW